MSEKYCCIIQDLLQNPFLDRPQSEKDSIIETGRPTPSMPKLTQQYRKVNRRFNPKHYKRYEWLCGCEDLNKLFCWYCLLFETKKAKFLWASTGYSNMRQFIMAATKHAFTHNHHKHLKEYQKFKGEETTEPTKPRKQLNKRCVINQILGIPFLKQSFPEQINIFKNGRPTPPLPILYVVESNNKISFNPENYLKYKWMAGSQKLNRLYCWHCLLFADESINADWISIGFNKMNRLEESAEAHESSEVHKELSLKYQQFYEVNKDLENWDDSILPDLNSCELIESDDEFSCFNNVKMEDVKEEIFDEIKEEIFDEVNVKEEQESFEESEIEDDEMEEETDSSDESSENEVETEKHCVINKILMDNVNKIFFRKYEDWEQREILQTGRPMPLIQGSKIGVENYNMHEWLTASVVTNKYYCWYCLLMKEPVDDTKFWGEEGISYARNVTKRAKIHEESTIHIQCTAKYNDSLIKHAVYIKSYKKSSSPEPESETSITETDIITYLINTSFDDLLPHDQQEILKTGRPTPDLSNLSGIFCGRKRYFRPVYYNKYTWLCGSSILNKLFCWYCLLSRKSLWGRDGITNIGKLAEILKKHDVSASHLQNMEKYHQPVEQVQEQQYLSNNVLSNNTRCLINELIGYPFLSRSRENQIEIVRNGRPTPTSNGSEDVFIEHFPAINYFKFDWLAGSKKLKRLFCWPCLLFGEETSQVQVLWTQRGFGKMRKFATAASKHENSKIHKALMDKFRSFKEEYEQDLQKGISQEEIN